MEIAQSADAQRVWCDIHQDRPDVDAGDQPPLYGRPHRNRQVGFDFAVNRAAESFFQELVYQRRPSCSSHQHDLVDLVGIDLGVSERLIQASERLQEQRADHFFVIVA